MALRSRRVVLTGAVSAAVASVMACGLVLGIDDIPSVNVAPTDSGPAKEKDARADHGVDARHERGVDARHDRGVDAPPDVALEAAIDAGDTGPVGQLPLPAGSQTTSTATINFAVHQLWLGDTAKNSAFLADTSAWATFGYNVDGLVTTSLSTDVCTLAPGALSTIQIDGEEGFDNSFGANIVSLLSIAFDGISKELTQRIEAGDFTFLLDTQGLTTSPTQTNQGLSVNFFGGAQITGMAPDGSTYMPTFTLADNWPVDPSTLADGRNLSSGAKTSLSDSYVTSGTWVSGDPTDFVFTVAFDGQPLALIIHQAVATFQHTVDDAGANHAVNGTIAGVLKPSEIISALQAVAGGIDDGMYCGLIPGFAHTITGAQDIMLDGTNMAGEDCNGVSIGLAFTADEIQPPSIVAPASTTDAAIPPCPTDAGDAAP